MEKSHEQHKQHAFDCFCKRMLKNEMRDYYSELNKRRKNEVSFSELSVAELQQLSAYDEYFADGHSFEVSQEQIIVKDDTIAEALAALPQNKRDIILLSYRIFSGSYAALGLPRPRFLSSFPATVIRGE